MAIKVTSCCLAKGSAFCWKMKRIQAWTQRLFQQSCRSNWRKQLHFQKSRWVTEVTMSLFLLRELFNSMLYVFNKSDNMCLDVTSSQRVLSLSLKRFSRAQHLVPQIFFLSFISHKTRIYLIFISTKANLITEVLFCWI